MHFWPLPERPWCWNVQGQQTYLLCLLHTCGSEFRLHTKGLHAKVLHCSFLFGQAKMVTCDAQDNTAKWNPSFLSVPLEVLYYVPRIEGPKNTDVMDDEVVKSNASNQQEPHWDDWSEGVPNLVGPETLNREEQEEDCHRDPDYFRCRKNDNREMLVFVTMNRGNNWSLIMSAALSSPYSESSLAPSPWSRLPQTALQNIHIQAHISTHTMQTY